jgi:hypothetical protein
MRKLEKEKEKEKTYNSQRETMRNPRPFEIEREVGL